MARSEPSLETAVELVRAASTLSLSTCDGDGAPCAAPLFYLLSPAAAPDAGDLRLYWLSSASARHSRNLRRDPRAAVATWHATERWQEIR